MLRAAVERGVPASWEPAMPAAPKKTKTKKNRPAHAAAEAAPGGNQRHARSCPRVAVVGQFFIYGLKAEQAVVMLIVREAFLKGELLNTVEIAGRADVDRKVAERALKRLAQKRCCPLFEKIGRENVHFTPAGPILTRTISSTDTSTASGVSDYARQQAEPKCRGARRRKTQGPYRRGRSRGRNRPRSPIDWTLSQGH